jgi:DNA-binding response OmpR family regulator
MGKKFIKILVVDDEEFLCQLYSEELSDVGYDVVTTTDGTKVMEAIQHYKPNVVVLDIRVGDCDGLDLLQRIRYRYHDMPVILNSAYSLYKSDLRSIAADYYVVKSGDITELKTRIGQAVESAPQHELHFDTVIMEGDVREQARHSVGG